MIPKAETTQLDYLFALQKACEDDLYKLLNINLNSADAKAKFDEEKLVVWGKVEMIVKYRQHAVRRKYKFKGWKTEICPLGMLCALRAPLEMINDAYSVYPDAGSDAFRFACRHNAELDTIKWLYSKSPNIVQSVSPSSHWLPLHHACVQKGSLELVEFLYDKFPEALDHKDEQKWTPCIWPFGCRHFL